MLIFLSLISLYHKVIGRVSPVAFQVLDESSSFFMLLFRLITLKEPPLNRKNALDSPNGSEYRRQTFLLSSAVMTCGDNGGRGRTASPKALARSSSHNAAAHCLRPVYRELMYLICQKDSPYHEDMDCRE